MFVYYINIYVENVELIFRLTYGFMVTFKGKHLFIYTILPKYNMLVMKESNNWNLQKFIISIEFYTVQTDFCPVFCGILKLKGNVPCVNLAHSIIHAGY